MLERALKVRPATICEMAQAWGVSERTIYRDLQDLQLAPLEVPLECRELWAVHGLLAKLGQDLTS